MAADICGPIGSPGPACSVCERCTAEVLLAEAAARESALREDISRYVSRDTERLAEVEKLREALKPFADGADTVEKSYSTAPHMLTDDLMTGYWPMTLGGLRRARSVLTGTEAPGSSVTAEEASDHTRLPKSI